VAFLKEACSDSGFETSQPDKRLSLVFVALSEHDKPERSRDEILREFPWVTAVAVPWDAELSFGERIIVDSVKPEVIQAVLGLGRHLLEINARVWATDEQSRYRAR
jgi:hypothetical protein